VLDPVNVLGAVVGGIKIADGIKVVDWLTIR
jgi:hypothetical protein